MAKGDITANERIWLNADRSKALPEGHADASFLLAGEGGVVNAADAEQYGIGEDGKVGKKAAKKDDHHEEGDLATRDGVLKSSKAAKK